MPTPFLHRTATEHRARVAGMSEVQNAVLQLPAGADRHTIERTIRGVYQQAIREQAGQYVRTQSHLSTWQRICRFFRRK